MLRRPAPGRAEPAVHRDSCPLAHLERLQAADRHLYFCTCWCETSNLSAADRRRLRETLAHADRLSHRS